MATDHFSELWADMLADLPDDKLSDELSEDAMRGVALHFYEAGRIQIKAEIRQALIAEAARLDDHLDGAEEDCLPERADALRAFAAGLALKGGE